MSCPNDYTLSLPPPGFTVGRTIDAEKMKQLVHFIEEFERHHWIESDHQTSRHTLNFGWHYADMEKENYHFVELPLFLQEIRSEMFHSVNQDLQNGNKPQDFDNMIITIYEKGHYLIPHYDADNCPSPLTKRNFHFKDPIIGLVVETDPQSAFTFYHHDKPGRPSFADTPYYQLKEHPGATFLIQKESRHAPFFHAIPPAKNRRISITIRQTVLPTQS